MHTTTASRRLKRPTLIAATAAVAAIALLAQGSVATDAAWTDEEWVHSALATTDCASPDAIATRGEGRALSGVLLTDLDILAEASGVEVTHNGERSKETSGSATALGNHAYANPLDVTALSAVNIDLGQGMLQLPLNNSTGVLGQYAQATGDATSVGAGGYVTSTGAIATAPGDNYPDLATLSLSSLVSSVNPGVAALIGALTDVTLKVGAATGRATLDGCDLLWHGPTTPVPGVADGNLTREYLLSHLHTDVESPTIGALGSALSNTTDTLETTANELVGNSGVLSSVVSSVLDTVTGALNLVTSLLGLRVTPNAANATVTSLTLDLSSVRALINEPVSDAAGVVSITAADGLVRIDTAALLAEAYPGTYSNGLNGLSPNHEPLREQDVLDTLTTRVTALITDLLTSVETELENALDAAAIEAVISVPIQQRCLVILICDWEDAGAIGVTVSGTLGNLLLDAGTVNVDTSALNALPLGDLLGTVVNSLVSGLTSTVGALVGGAINDVLRPLTKLPTGVMQDVGTPIITLVTTVYRELYLNGVVSLTINAQNDPLTGDPEPFDLQPLSDTRFDVAALRVGVLDALGTDIVRLYLARGSVGEVCSAATVAAGGCAGH